MPDTVTKLEYIATHLAAGICANSIGLNSNFTPESIKSACADSVKVYTSVLEALKSSIK